MRRSWWFSGFPNIDGMLGSDLCLPLVFRNFLCPSASDPITPLYPRASDPSIKATITVGLKDAGMDISFEFDLANAADAGRFKALGTLLARVSM